MSFDRSFTKLKNMNNNKKVIWSSADEPKDNPKLRLNLLMIAIFFNVAENLTFCFSRVFARAFV
jgi:hypothetical protein